MNEMRFNLLYSTYDEFDSCFYLCKSTFSDLFPKMSSTIFCSNEAVTLERTIESTEHEIKLEEIWNEAELCKCMTWIKSNDFKNVCLQFSDELLVFR